MTLTDSVPGTQVMILSGFSINSNNLSIGAATVKLPSINITSSHTNLFATAIKHFLALC